MALQKDELLNMVDQMPTFSQNVTRILELTSDVNVAPKDLVGLVEHDPVLTLKVLKLVNSAYFGLSRQVTSIKQGVVYVGINTIKNLAITVAAIGSLPQENEAGFDADEFWDHSLVTATVARVLAQKRGFPKTEVTSFFIAGLLHDIGQLVFAQYLPDQYQLALRAVSEQQKPLHVVEQDLIGSDHSEVGALLAERWQLPAELVECIRYHHDIESLQEPAAIHYIVLVANQIAKLLESPERRISLPEPVPQIVTDWLGCSVEEVLEQLPDLNSEIEKSRSFIQI